MSLDTIRLPQKTKDRLIVLKRRTGIEQWNILLRWAISRSLQEPASTDKSTSANPTSALEIEWSTLTGDLKSVFEALLAEEKQLQQLEVAPLTRKHICRGVDYLFAEISKGDGISELLRRAMGQDKKT